MEKLTINVPDKKVALVKQVLQGLGIAVPGAEAPSAAAYKAKIAQVGVWSAEDTEGLDEARKAFNSLQPEQW